MNQKNQNLYCNSCEKNVTPKVAEYSWKNFQRILCMDCQKQPQKVQIKQPERTVYPKVYTENRQQGIEETARLRRELDWQLAALNGAISLVESGKRTPEQLYETWKAICEFPEIERGATKIPVEKVK